jgi:tRNA pseudouridine55 synthase
MVESKLLDFIGTIQQMPPMYSAVKVGGQRLYKLARAGIEVEREARTVMVYSIQLLNFSPPSIMLDVETGRGVYVRSLAHDLGEALGCGGYVTKLERLKCGAFTSSESVTLEQLEQSNTPESHGWHQYLHPIDWALLDSRSLMVGRLAETYIRNGQSITLDQPIDDVGYLETFRAYSTNGHFLALVRFDRAANAWRPTKVFQIDSRSPYAPRNNRF